MFFDTHAHLNFRAYNQDREKVIKECLDNDIWFLNVGTNLITSQKAVQIAQGYNEGVYASVGLHPINLDTGLVKIKGDSEEGINFEKEFNYSKYKELCLNNKVVAIGETGLDYYWKPKTKRRLEEFKEKQKDLFIKHIHLAKELNLPLIFHCRMAHNDLLGILKEIDGIRGVIHCFTGNYIQAKEYLDMGFFLGFNGIIFKLNLDEIIEKVPLERTLIETDCPYLSPPGYMKEKNDPLGVEFVAKRIAQLRGLDLEEVAEKTADNAKRLFSNKIGDF